MATILTVTVDLEDWTGQHKWPALAAYVFSRQGRLLVRAPVEPQHDEPAGVARVEVPAGSLMVKIGPEVVDPGDLGRYDVQTVKVMAVDGEPAEVAVRLAKAVWWCWIKVPYVVRGDVNKSEAGHLSPICHGQVDIFDVDIGRCWWRLPDAILERIRASLIDLVLDPPPVDLQELEHWPRWEDDWCGTRPKSPVPPRPVDVARRLETLPREWAFARARFAAVPRARARMDETLGRLAPADRQAFLNRQAVKGVAISELLYTNTDQLRTLLAKNWLAFRFWLCWWPWIYWLWWPLCWWYSLEKLGTATLQPDGTFSATVRISICRTDVPDLWFVVRQSTYGLERVIFARHPVPCHTYWNHPSGSPVHLVVTDPLALACHPDPGTDLDPDWLWIIPLAVGDISLKRIWGTGAGAGIIPSTHVDAGKYESLGTGLGGSLATFYKGPFGGLLGLRFLFSPALLDAGVRYYRIKARVHAGGEWTPLTHPVVRHYSHYNPITHSPEFPAYPLGPTSAGGEDALFELQPVDPPNKAAEPYAEWVPYDAHVDLISGYLDSGNMRIDAERETNYGDVSFKLELFDAAGARLDPAALGISFRLPATDDVWGDITTCDPATVNPDLVGADPEAPGVQTFVFRLQVDNRPPVALIPEPELNASHQTTGPCGMMHPTPADTELLLTYEATHPGRFAMFRFYVVRGAPPELRVEEDQALAAGTFAYGGARLNVGADPTANDLPVLLGPCPSAAFSANLHIWSMATDGWTLVGPYAGYVRAFALT